MNYPAASCAVSQERDGKYPKAITPECFYRGPVPDPPGFPLKTCGNDGIRKEINLTQQAAGNMTRSDSNDLNFLNGLNDLNAYFRPNSRNAFCQPVASLS